MLVDTHVHLDWFPEEAVAAIVDRASAAGVDRMLTVGSDLNSSARAVEIARRFEPVLAAVGCHPTHLTGEWSEESLLRLADLAADPRVVAIGEIGLDSVSGRVSVESQESAFRDQLRLARRLKLPALLHVRAAFGRLFDSLEEEGVGPGQAVVHYFQGDAELARRCIGRGLYLSFGRSLLRSADIQQVAADLPLEWLLVETDAYPREAGRWTEPAAVRPVAEMLAEIRGMGLEALAGALMDNWERLLRAG